MAEKESLYLIGSEGELYRIPLKELEKFKVSKEERERYVRLAEAPLKAACACLDEPEEWGVY